MSSLSAICFLDIVDLRAECGRPERVDFAALQISAGLRIGEDPWIFPIIAVSKRCVSEANFDILVPQVFGLDAVAFAVEPFGLPMMASGEYQ